MAFPFSFGKPEKMKQDDVANFNDALYILQCYNTEADLPGYPLSALASVARH